jgi:hypothetical protein
MLLDVDAQPTARVHKTDKHVGEFILNRVFYPVLERPLVLDGVEIGSTPTMLAISLQRFTGLTLQQSDLLGEKDVAESFVKLFSGFSGGTILYSVAQSEFVFVEFVVNRILMRGVPVFIQCHFLLILFEFYLWFLLFRTYSSCTLA